MTFETVQELADVGEDEKELEVLPISTLRLRRKRIEELESIKPLAMVDRKGKG